MAQVLENRGQQALTYIGMLQVLHVEGAYNDSISATTRLIRNGTQNAPPSWVSPLTVLEFHIIIG